MSLDFLTALLFFLFLGGAMIFIEAIDKLAHTIRVGRKMRSLKRDKRGLIYVWVVVLLAIPFYAFLHFILLGPATSIIYVASGFQNLPPQAVSTINLWISILTWIPMFFLIAMLIWAISNSQKRDPYQ